MLTKYMEEEFFELSGRGLSDGLSVGEADAIAMRHLMREYPFLRFEDFVEVRSREPLRAEIQRQRSTYGR